MIKNNRGISAVVATVLIILITVAAVTIIWSAIIPMVKNQIETGTVCFDAVSELSIVTNQGYTCIKGDGNISIQISRGAKEIDLKKIQVLVSIGGDTAAYELNDTNKLPKANEAKVFNVNYTQLNITADQLKKADEVKIAPIVGVGNTEERCEVSATAPLNLCTG